MAMTVAAIPSQSNVKQKGVFKKVIKYLQDQAVENSGRSFTTPPGLEPHQRFKHSQHSSGDHQHQDYIISTRRFSEATTAVETRQNFRRAARMAGDGVDDGVILDPSASYTREMKKVQYAQDNILQNYRIYIPERDPESVQGSQYWIVYIHGGYFRSPDVDALSLRPALEILTSEGSRSNPSSSLATVPESAEPSPASSRRTSLRENDLVRQHVAGYVSINYRLAPHPDFPQDDNVENYVKRNARFPQQLHDVHAAIRHLQTRYEITDNYILAGHSVGATLAFLAALKAKDGQIDPPKCIIGLNGIYDFIQIHKTNPEYEAMTGNTMTPDQYRTASPAYYPQTDYANVLPKGDLRILLSHSRDDGLVGWTQVEKIQETLKTNNEGLQLHVETMETKGQHDDIWKKGGELARTLVHGLRMVTDY